MLRFTVDGEKREFDNARLMKSEAIAIRRYTEGTFGVQEFWDALTKIDPDAVAALVWLTNQRDGREGKFSELDFDLMEVLTTLESDEEPDDESDPTDSTTKPEPT